MVFWLERDADLHMAQLMPLPLTVSCFSKIQIGFTCLVPAHPGSPGQSAIRADTHAWQKHSPTGLLSTSTCSLVTAQEIQYRLIQLCEFLTVAG